MAASQIASKLLLWIIFAVLFANALRRGKLNSLSSRRIWLTAFLGCGAATLWGADTEQYLDTQFGGLPVTVFLKCFFILATTLVYFLILCDIKFAEVRARQALEVIGKTALVSTVVGFLLSVFVIPVERESLRYIVNAVRDGVVLLFILVAFIPSVYRMFKRENVLPMKLKHGGLVLFFGTYAVVCIGNIVALVLRLVDSPYLQQSEATYTYAVYLCFVFFSFLMIPHQWLLAFVFPVRLYTYLRLRRVERMVAVLAGAEPELTSKAALLLRLDGLELAIYQSVISVLDQYAVLRDCPGGKRLFQQVQTILSRNPSYPELVQQIAAIQS